MLDDIDMLTTDNDITITLTIDGSDVKLKVDSAYEGVEDFTKTYVGVGGLIQGATAIEGVGNAITYATNTATGE